jgi:hypothetical protein
MSAASAQPALPPPLSPRDGTETLARKLFEAERIWYGNRDGTGWESEREMNKSYWRFLAASILEDAE